MDWINLHIPSVTRSPEYVGSSPSERGTWLSVLSYACEIECSGVLDGAADWKDRQWQQACGVTLREVKAASRLLRFNGKALVVNGYPKEKEAHVKQARGIGKAGAMSRWTKADGMPNGIPDGMPNGNANLGGTPMPTGHAEGEGELRRGRVTATASLRDYRDETEDITTPAPIAAASTSDPLAKAYDQTAQTLRRAGARLRGAGGVDLLVEWRGVVARCGIDRVLTQLAASLPNDRWPEKIETALSAGDQSDLPPLIRFDDENP